MVITVGLTWRWRISGFEKFNLAPSMHWPAPMVHASVTHDRGPVLVTIYYQAAPEEVRYLLYGHTHEARHDFLSVGPASQVRLYINTGTYLPLIQKTGSGKAFSTSNQMNIAFFHRRDEDTHNGPKTQPTLDLWNGIQVKVI